MITIAGKKYAKNNAEMTDSLFASGGTCVGYYAERKRGVLLLDLQKNPFAFAVIDPSSAWFVTTGKLENGRTLYMQGLAEYTEKQLGIHGLTYSQQVDEARSIASQLNDSKMRESATLAEVGIRWPDGLQNY